MEALRQVVEVPAQRIGHRLSLVVVVEAGQVAPALVPAHLDEPGAELDAEQKPAHEHDEAELRRRRGRTQEDREEAGFQQERLPAERVKGLADVHDREIEHPQHREDQHRCERDREVVAVEQADDGEHRQDDAGPGDDEELAIRIAE